MVLFIGHTSPQTWTSAVRSSVVNALLFIFVFEISAFKFPKQNELWRFISMYRCWPFRFTLAKFLEKGALLAFFHFKNRRLFQTCNHWMGRHIQVLVMSAFSSFLKLIEYYSWHLSYISCNGTWRLRSITTPFWTILSSLTSPSVHILGYCSQPLYRFTNSKEYESNRFDIRVACACKIC